MSSSDMDAESDSDEAGSPSPVTGTVPLEEFQAIRKQNDVLVKQVENLTNQVSKLRQQLSEALKQNKTSEVRSAQTERQLKRRKAEQTDSGPSDTESQQNKPGPQKRTMVESKTPVIPSTSNKTPRSAETPNTSTTNNQREQQETATQKIPPVVLRKKDRWTSVSNLLKEERISYTKAKLVGEGIAITPATVGDYRKLTRILNTNEEEYHTYTLQEDKLLRVVMRGIPDGVNEQQIKEDIQNQGFNPQKVHRMTSRKTKQNMPLILIQVPQEQTGILEVNRCCSLVVRVEKQRISNQATQCHRCQRYGHGQSRCQAQPKYVKCGETHETKDCKKSREEPAKCANCQGPHPASYRGCPNFPKQNKKTNILEQQINKETQSNGNHTKPRNYAEAAKGKQTNPRQQQGNRNGNERGNIDLETASNMLAQFQQMFMEMQKFCNKMSPLIQVNG